MKALHYVEILKEAFPERNTAMEQAAVTTAPAVAAAAAMTSSRAPIAPMTVEGREIGATAERHHQHHTVHVDLLRN